MFARRGTSFSTKSLRPWTQRRTFLGLQQTPPPKPRMMGYLVMQGLAVVLLADFGFATLLHHPTATRTILESAGIWRKGPSFEDSHQSGGAEE